ncbi:glycosyltransferase [Candidatus Microgenomates bacterium]|nr:glycosyltransferase [Candidatus Microgenomates bacterium]
MKVAIVHDYLNEFGGAERVVLAMSAIWPDAPIYTSFYKKGSPAWERFKDKDVRVSWVHYIPFFATFLHSPLRFLAPLIWNSWDFSAYDVVITSSGWYVTKGIRKGPKTVEICYCHTPPRWLYGYKTSIEFQKYWPVRVYAAIVGHFMRMYDFWAAQRVNYFIANSQNVQARIEKFYRRESTVIYPPVSLDVRGLSLELSKKSNVQNLKSNNYFLVISRIVGGKGLDLAVEAALRLGLKLKIAGRPAGYYTEYKKLAKRAGGKVEFLGYVSDEELVRLHQGAKAFLALATDEDFGMTVVEAQACGTPVIAYKGGGYLETVIDGKTGMFFDEPNVDALVNTLKQFDSKKWNHALIAKHAQKFSKTRFQKEIQEFVEKHLK